SSKGQSTPRRVDTCYWARRQRAVRAQPSISGLISPDYQDEAEKRALRFRSALVEPEWDRNQDVRPRIGASDNRRDHRVRVIRNSNDEAVVVCPGVLG